MKKAVETPSITKIYHNHPDNAVLCSVKDVCSRLSLGKTSVFSLMKENRIQRVKSGRRSLIVKESVDNYISSLIAQQGGDHGCTNLR